MKLRFIAAAAVAASGLTAAIFATPNGHAEFGVVRRAAITAAGHDGGIGNGLGDQLAHIRQSLAIRPEQDAAWQRYADTMRHLDETSRDFERRLAEGEVKDDGTARLVHALTLNAAILDLQAKLSADQVAHARLLTNQLAGSFICKGLVGN